MIIYVPWNNWLHTVSLKSTNFWSIDGVYTLNINRISVGLEISYPKATISPHRVSANRSCSSSNFKDEGRWQKAMSTGNLTFNSQVLTWACKDKCKSVSEWVSQQELIFGPVLEPFGPDFEVFWHIWAWIGGIWPLLEPFGPDCEVFWHIWTDCGQSGPVLGPFGPDMRLNTSAGPYFQPVHRCDRSSLFHS